MGIPIKHICLLIVYIKHCIVKLYCFGKYVIMLLILFLMKINDYKYYRSYLSRTKHIYKYILISNTL